MAVPASRRTLAHPITADDIAANPQWRARNGVGTSRDADRHAPNLRGQVHLS
jgi:hypothetical protein